MTVSNGDGKEEEVDSSLEILTKIKNTEDYMVRPDKVERKINYSKITYL